MTLDELLPRLDSVRQRGNGRYSARCPAHADTSPSLSISEGKKGLLFRCWAGCSLVAICAGIGITQQDLFFDALDSDPFRRRDAARQRAQRQQDQADIARTQGRRIDALREADYFVRSRHGLDVSQWSDQHLDDELNLLADGRSLLASEDWR